MLVIANGRFYPYNPILVSVNRETESRYYGRQIPRTQGYSSDMNGNERDPYVEKVNVIAIDVTEELYRKVVEMVEWHTKEKRALDDHIAELKMNLRESHANELERLINEHRAI